MRADFSPTAAAARRLAAPGGIRPVSPSTPPMPVRSGEWPPRAPAPRAGIWRTLQQIQTRHA